MATPNDAATKNTTNKEPNERVKLALRKRIGYITCMKSELMNTGV